MTRKHTSVVLIVMIGLALALIIAGERAAAYGQMQSPIPSLANSLNNLGSGFTYQGFVQDDGNPINDACDFTFALYDAATAGAQVGTTETETNVTVSEGRFTVQLNETGQFGLAAFDGAARWLEVAVRCPAGSGSYTTLTPRQSLNASPYALSLRPGAMISGTAGLGVLRLNNSNGNGLYVGHANQDGVLVNSAGWDGLAVNAAGGNGVRVFSAGTDIGDDGVQIDYAGGNGVYVDFAEGDGIRVDSTFNSGVHVVGADSDGVHVNSAGNIGLRVDSAGADGVNIGTAGGTGLQVDSAGIDGVHIFSAVFDGVEVVAAGADGLNVDSADGDGLEVFQAGNEGVDVAGDVLAGYFFGNIQVTGSCGGCALATFGINSSQQPLQPRTIVALQGSLPSQVDSVPLLLEVGPAGGGEAIVGVVQGRAELLIGDEPRPDELGRRLIPREGAAAPGEYVTIIIYGLAQVQAAALDNPIVGGDRITVNENGAARPLQTTEVNGIRLAEDAPTLGIALEGPAAGEEGLIWVLVNPH